MIIRIADKIVSNDCEGESGQNVVKPSIFWGCVCVGGGEAVCRFTEGFHDFSICIESHQQWRNSGSCRLAREVPTN